MIARGQLWWADLGEPRGSAPALRRPMLVVSADAYNRSRIATVLCASVTGNLRLGEAPGNVTVERGVGGLPEASVINVSQIVTLNKEDLEEPIGELPAPQMALVDAGLRRVLTV